MRMRLAILLLFTVALFCTFPGHSLAAGMADPEQWTFGIVPADDPAITAKGYFVYRMEPGRQTSGKVLVQNASTATVTIELAAVDAGTAQTGGSSFAGVETPAALVARWITLDVRHVIVPPHTNQSVGFTLHTPDTVRPGQYLGGITAYTAKGASGASQTMQPKGFGASIEIHKRYVIGVEADVPGVWVPSLSVPKVTLDDQPSGPVLGIQMSNDGDVFLKPSGAITVTNAAGAEILAQPVPMDTFVPHTAVTYPIRWTAKAATGTYHVAVDLAYANGKHASYNDTVTISPAVVAHAAVVVAASTPAGGAAAPIAPGLQPWILYSMGGLAGLLVIMIILLALNLRRRHPEPKQR